MRLKVYLTLLLTFVVACLCGLLIYALVPYKEIIAQGLLKGFVGIGIVLFVLLLVALLRVLALLRHRKQMRLLEQEQTRLALLAQQQALEIERENHELHRYLALTRVLPDGIGNYPALIDIPQERITILTPGNFMQPVPNNYAPRIEYHYPKDGLSTVTPEEEQPPLGLPAPRVPTLAEQLQRGETMPYEVESILGYHADGMPRKGQWHKLHSFSTFGASGSGKSSTVAYYAALAVLHAARLLVIDPDAEEDDSLTRRLANLAFALLCPIGDTPQRAAKVLDVVEQELLTPGDYPVVWITDEFSSIMRQGEKGLKGWGELAERLAYHTEDWAQRGRKRRRTTIVIGQISKASRTGGTETKYSMTATFVHRLHAQQARLLLDGPDAKQCPYLAVGEVMVLLNNSPETYRMHIPYADAAAMQIVADLMASNHKTHRFDPVSGQALPAGSQDWKPSRNTLETPDEAAWQAKVNRMRELRHKGRTQRDILYQIWGVTPGGSPDYAQAKAEYRQILALLNAEQTDGESED